MEGDDAAAALEGPKGFWNRVDADDVGSVSCLGGVPETVADFVKKAAVEWGAVGGGCAEVELPEQRSCSATERGGRESLYAGGLVAIPKRSGVIRKIL